LDRFNSMQQRISTENKRMDVRRGRELRRTQNHILQYFAERSGGTAIYYPGKRYFMKAEDWGNFVNKLTANLLLNFECLNSSKDLPQCDEELRNKVRLGTDIGESIHKFITAVASASDSAFKISRPGKRAMKERSVPWWNEDLTLLRKKTLALRRSYQRTKNDENLRQQRRFQYREGNRR